MRRIEHHQLVFFRGVVVLGAMADDRDVGCVAGCPVGLRASLAALERLEERRLLSGAVSISAGVLVMQQNYGANTIRGA
jgi:hypothetical protein